MALEERTVSISLRFATTQTVPKKVRFIPDLAAGDSEILLEEVYEATVSPTTPTASATLEGSIPLPVKTSGSISYRVDLPVTTGPNSHYITLVKGNGQTVNLATLLTSVP